MRKQEKANLQACQTYQPQAPEAKGTKPYFSADRLLGSSSPRLRLQYEFALNGMVKATGTPIPWEEGIVHLPYVREHGVAQFLKLYHELKEISGDKVSDKQGKTKLKTALALPFWRDGVL